MSNEDFVELWKNTASLQEVADKLGVAYNTAAKRASRLRAQGYDLPRKFLDREHYSRIGKIGGKKGRTGGFYANRELASRAGAKGGRISRRKYE